MANRDRVRERGDWASRVPPHRWRGPYDDYGWERGDSILPEFRDPSVHDMPGEEERFRARPPSGPEWDRPPYPGPRGYPEDEDVDRFQRAYDWDSGRALYPDPGEWSRYRGTRSVRMRRSYGPADRGWEAGYDLEGLDTGERAWDVPGPFTGRGPRGYQRSSERIRDDVAQRLTHHGWLDASNIEIQVQDGEVTLTGTVDSRRAKRMAEDTADSVDGVVDVHNELRIVAGRSGQGSGPES